MEQVEKVLKDTFVSSVVMSLRKKRRRKKHRIQGNEKTNSEKNLTTKHCVFPLTRGKLNSY